MQRSASKIWRAGSAFKLFPYTLDIVESNTSCSTAVVDNKKIGNN